MTTAAQAMPETNASEGRKTPAKTAARRAIKSERAEGRSERAHPSDAQKTKRAQTAAARSRVKADAKKPAEGKGLDDLFEHVLKDMYYAEKKIHRALPKMIRAADHPDLRKALESHREETLAQIEKLEAIFELRGQRPKGEKCDAIDGILEECEGILEDFADGPAADAAIILACQAVEHYEITRYGTMSAFADALGMTEAKTHIAFILDQEKAANQHLTAIAEGAVNDAAAEYDAEDEADQKNEESKPAEAKTKTADQKAEKKTEKTGSDAKSDKTSEKSAPKSGGRAS